MNEMESILNVSEYIANVICGIYFIFGILACIGIECLFDYLCEKIKNKRKDKDNND